MSFFINSKTLYKISIGYWKLSEKLNISQNFIFSLFIINENIFYVFKRFVNKNFIEIILT